MQSQQQKRVQAMNRACPDPTATAPRTLRFGPGDGYMSGIEDDYLVLGIRFG